MKASDLFVRSLEQEGVEYIFGVPGEETLNLMESLRNSKIQFILTRHEQAAGFMAATYGRLTGKVGVCLSTLGPGVTNLVTAGAYAQLGAMPMLMISGQKPIKKSKQARFQIVDAVSMMRPLTKSTRQVVHGNSIPVIVRESVRLAQEERPGAVHIELPEDIAEEHCTTRPYPVHATRRPHADELAIAQAADMLKAAQLPHQPGAQAVCRSHRPLLFQYPDGQRRGGRATPEIPGHRRPVAQGLPASRHRARRSHPQRRP